MKKKILIFAFAALSLTACDDLFTPADENFKDIEQMYDDAQYAQGFLVTTYRNVPGIYDNSEYATDDAVQNQKSDAFMTIATGGWTASTWTALNQWTNSYNSIQYINLFLENTDKVKWAENPETNALFLQRTKGEAYGLRGMFLYYLLRAHAGFSADGQLLGVPIHTESETVNSDFNQERPSFQACVEQIKSDLQQAIALLPQEYEDVSTVPASMQGITQDASIYNNVMGAKARQLMNATIAKAYLVRTELLAASPAYQDATNQTTWADAANAAADLLKQNGGLSGLDQNGVQYYEASYADNVKDGVNPKEILWRANVSSGDNDQESANFPPTLFGSGKMNPSQNLVDAFPMANGYPISDLANSGYDPQNPYAGRDPRLAKYIIYNGAPEGTANTPIYTGRNSGTDDGIDVKEQKSTRTGYYMKKRLRMDVNCNPNSTSKKAHYIPRVRYTEMYLAYAEAANEAWGPMNSNGNGFSAYDVIRAIRQRAGVGGDSDAYLDECAQSKEKMRELIKNERRLELCFEGFRFWDLRRWNDNLNETVRGIDWAADGQSYEIFDVETRDFEDYMRYCPIPYSETLKYSNLIQNRGWK